MKRLMLLLVTGFLFSTAHAQIDSTDVVADTTAPAKRDTLRIGNIIIIKKGKDGDNGSGGITLSRKAPRKKSSRITTNWWIVDFGLANYIDKTDYATVGNYLVDRPGYPALDENDFKLRAGKSVNVNIWIFMQRMALIKRNVNLKYGLGLELNNYRFKSAVTFRENGEIPYSGGMQTNAPFIFRDSISFKKNKLAADYLTVPVMLNFRTTPANGKKGVGISFGISGSYLYSQRNKQKSEARGKQKGKGDYDLNRFKYAYMGELSLGPVMLYGTYSPKSMFDNNMDFRPYTLGIRLSNL